MKGLTVKELYTLEETIAKDLFEGVTYPWEVLPRISEFILRLGATLSEDEYDKVGEDVWIAKSAKVFESAYIHGPAIIGKDAEVRQCAFIRGNAIVGEGAVVGNSTELKNVILFNKVQVPHYNYVGDSILGYKAHMGGEDSGRQYRDRDQEVRSHARGRGGSRMRHGSESGKRGGQPYQYLSAFQCQGIRAVRKYL